MKVSNVMVWPVTKTDSKLKANGIMTLEGVVKVKYHLMQGKNGLFVAFPSEKYTDKQGETKYSNFVELVNEEGKFNKEAQQEVNEVIIAAYNEQMSGKETNTSKPTKKNNIPF